MFESFAERDGQVVRQVLVGAGKTEVDDRSAALEKAGAALAARYLTSGETGIALDVSGSKLSASEVASVLLGLRLPLRPPPRWRPRCGWGCWPGFSASCR